MAQQPQQRRHFQASVATITHDKGIKARDGAIPKRKPLVLGTKQQKAFIQNDQVFWRRFYLSSAFLSYSKAEENIAGPASVDLSSNRPHFPLPTIQS
jgi:hypothetical protein